MVRMFKALAVALVIALTAGAAGISVAEESEDGGGRGNPAGRLGRVVRGDLVVLDRDGNTKGIHIESGTVGDVTDSGFVLTGPDDAEVSIRYGDDTRFLPDVDDPADLEGRRVRVIAETKEGDDWLATAVLAGRRGDRGRRGDTDGPAGGGSGGF